MFFPLVLLPGINCSPNRRSFRERISWSLMQEDFVNLCIERVVVLHYRCEAGWRLQLLFSRSCYEWESAPTGAIVWPFPGARVGAWCWPYQTSNPIQSRFLCLEFWAWIPGLGFLDLAENPDLLPEVIKPMTFSSQLQIIGSSHESWGDLGGNPRRRPVPF